MQALAGWVAWGEVLLPCAGAVLVWALSLYVVSRGGWGRVPTLAALAMWALVVYELGGGLAALAPDAGAWAAWLRATWPGPALLPALWLLLTAALAAAEAEPAQRPRRQGLFRLALAVPLPLGLLFAAAAPTELVRRWGLVRDTLTPALRHDLPGPLYPAFVAYVLVCAAWAAANVVAVWRGSAPGTPLRTRFRWLVVAAGLFLLGGAYLTAAAGPAGQSGLPGHALLLAGMVITGWSVARYGALLSGEVVAGDARAFGLTTGAVVALYGAALLAAAPFGYAWLARLLPVLLLAVATHVVVERRGPLVERLLYGSAAGPLRAQLGALANRVARRPDAVTALADVREGIDALVRTEDARLDLAAAGPALLADGRDGAAPGGPAPAAPPGAAPPRAGGDGGRPAPTGLRVLVEGALRHLNDLPALAEHPLLDRFPPPEGAPGTALERAARLRGELAAAIGRLRPPGPRPLPGPSAGQGGWLHFLVLHEAYVEGRPNKQIMQRYHLSEGTFHRARRRAVDAVAQDLAERGPAPVGPAPAGRE